MHVFSTYMEYLSHMVLIYLISPSMTLKMFSVCYTVNSIVLRQKSIRDFFKFYSGAVYNFEKIKHLFFEIWNGKNSSTLLFFNYFR